MKLLLQIPRAFYHGVLILSLPPFASAAAFDFPHCDCDGEGLWSTEGIRSCQKVSDLLISAAYFSITLELLYFLTGSNRFPFKWIVFQFSAFIVLCGLTHLLTAFTFKPHSFLLVLSLTIAKFLTALVSFLTAVTLLSLIPQLLRVKLRENFLRLKASELNREVGLMKRQKEASWHVRMLTQEIRKSLDKHTILYTTLVELSKTLQLQNCAVWMPNESKFVMNLTHELNRRNSSEPLSIPMDDPVVAEIKKSDGAKILRPDSALGSASSGAADESGAVAAIRMPMLKVSDFKGGTPEVIQACYAILVLVLPKNDPRIWSHHELKLIKVVADQVAVALSHAAVLEESHMIRDKLVQQNKALLQAKKKVMLASEASNLFRKVMNQGIRRPIHSTLGLLSVMQQSDLTPEQRLIVNAMAKTGSVVSTLINDVIEISREHFDLDMRPFQLQPLIKEAACISRALCDIRGFGFGFLVENMVLDQVIGDERRILHILLHIVGGLLNGPCGGCLTLRVWGDSGLADWQDKRWIWKSKISNVYSFVKFEIGIRRSLRLSASSSLHLNKRPGRGEGFDMGCSFNMCEKLVQMMQGNIFITPCSDGLPECVTLVLRLQLQSSTPAREPGIPSESHQLTASHLEGLKVLLVDDDGVNRVVTQKLLEKIGCCVSSLSSGTECLSSLGTPGVNFQLVILDLNMPDMNGYEVAAQISSSRTGRWPSIIALTASTDEHVWEKCVHSGMVGLIRKPAVLSELEKELLRVLRT